jgi:transposase
MSTGDRTILGRITKRGKRYLRMLFMQAARVVLIRPRSWIKHSFEPWPVFGAVDLGVANDRQRARCEQAAQIAITTLGDVTELLLATARVLLGHQPDPG